MSDLRRLEEEVDELMGSDVPTIRGTSACKSENKSERRVTLKRISVFHWRVEKARNGRAESINANYVAQIRTFPLQ